MPDASSSPAGLQPVRVWDLPTRLFHWLLAAGVVALVVTGKVGGNAMGWHIGLGCAVGGLLLFRLAWGLVGGHWSRLRRLLWSPAAVLRYLRGRPAAGERFDVGHNPVGSLSVIALLSVSALQVATGLVADDEIFTTGPLYRFVSGELASAATGWHTGPGQAALFVLVGLHLLAIVVYRIKGRQLVPPMLHGNQWLPAGTPASADGLPQRLLALALALACAALAGWVWSLG